MIILLYSHLCNKKYQHFSVLALNLTIISKCSFIVLCNTANLLRTNSSNELNFFTLYFLQFFLCMEYFSNLILFVYFVLVVFLLLFEIYFFPLAVKVWHPLPRVEEWAEENLCVLEGIIYYVKNKLILIFCSFFYHGRYIFLFWCQNESKEISIQKIFIAPWKI